MSLLKQLQTQKNKLSEEKKVIDAEVNRLVRQQKGLMDNINTLNQKIKNLLEAEVVLSEHAVLRYIERVQGVDVEAVKGKILDDTTKKQIETLGSGKYPKNGYTLVVKNNTIITVV